MIKIFSVSFYIMSNFFGFEMGFFAIDKSKPGRKLLN